MTKDPRGYCLIINNEEFDDMKDRKGSTVDANNLDMLFDQLGFKNVIRSNLKRKEMTEEVMGFADKKEHASSQMAVVVILSHGEKDYVLGTDGQRLNTERIIEWFNNDLCPSLQGKPKFFIFQACRGDADDQGVIHGFSSSMYSSTTETDAAPFAPRKRASFTDMLIGYATIPGYVANRDTVKGSWYIECICKVFMNNAANKDIREMMDMVSKELETYESQDRSKQSTTYENRSFHKKLYFNPGLYE